MYGIFIYLTGEDQDKLPGSGLNDRGCGQLQGVFHKCSDLTFGSVLGILCACGPDVCVVEGELSVTTRQWQPSQNQVDINAIQIDSSVVRFFCVYLAIKGFLRFLYSGQIQSLACFRKWTGKHFLNFQRRIQGKFYSLRNRYKLAVCISVHFSPQYPFVIFLSLKKSFAVNLKSSKFWLGNNLEAGVEASNEWFILYTIPELSLIYYILLLLYAESWKHSVNLWTKLAHFCSF